MVRCFIQHGGVAMFAALERLYWDTSTLTTPLFASYHVHEDKSHKLHNFLGADWGLQGGRMRNKTRTLADSVESGSGVPAWRCCALLCVAALPAKRAMSATQMSHTGHQGTVVGGLVVRLRETISFREEYTTSLFSNLTDTPTS